MKGASPVYLLAGRILPAVRSPDEIAPAAAGWADLPLS